MSTAPNAPIPPKKEPFQNSDLFIILSLFCCAPVGLIYMWGNQKWTLGVRIGVTAAVGILMVIALAAPDRPTEIGSKNPDLNPDSSVSEVLAAAAKHADAEKAAALVFIQDSCYDLAKNFGPQSKMSELQKEELWKEYKGKAFEWDLKVTEVDSDVFGGFSVQYTCAPKSDSFISDIMLKYAEDQKAIVLKLTKGETYRVKGVLVRSGTLLGMSGDAL